MATSTPPGEGPLETAWSLPPRWFTDPAVFELEKERIFARDWICVARAEQIERPGDYRTVELPDAPIALVRGADGEIRALSNVCVHRSMRILEGSGNAPSLMCPYHRWSYDLDGSLRGAPLMDRSKAFDPTACSLPQLRTEVWEGFVFVSRDPHARPLGPQLEPLRRHIAEYSMADLRLATQLEYDSPWNWKVMVENFMESYHHIGPHRDTLHPTNPAQLTYTEPLEGPFALLENPQPKDGSGLWVMGIWPYTLLAIPRGDLRLAIWYQMDIDAHDHFDLTIHVLLPPELADNDAVVELAAKQVDAIHQQDIPVCEGVWKGVQSRYARRGPLSHLEASLLRFQRYLRDRLGPLHG